MWCLSLLILSVLSLLSWGTVLAQEQSAETSQEVVEYTLKWPRDAGDPFCLSMPDMQDVIRKAQEYPNLLKQRDKLQEEKAELKDQVQDLTEKAQINEERRQLQEEKTEFYKMMAEEYKKLADRQATVIDKQNAQLQRKAFWDTIKTIVGVGIGVLIGAAF